MARWLIVVLLAVAALTSARSVAESAAPCVTATPSGNRLDFAGAAGDSVTTPFALPEGTVIVEAEMAGDGNNHASLVAAPGSKGSAIAFGFVSDTGPYKGSNAITILAAGEFVLAINAAGDWHVTLTY
jgi:hypothetical protein